MPKFILRKPELEAIQVTPDTWRVTFPGHATEHVWYTDRLFRECFVAMPEEVIADGVTIRIDTTPAPFMAPNVNTGVKAWVGAASRKEKARLHTAAKEAGAAMLEELGKPAPLFADNAQVFVTVAWGKRKLKNSDTMRWRQNVDAHDALPIMCKGIIDGLTESGILADDRNIRSNYQQTRDPAQTGYVEVMLKP